MEYQFLEPNGDYFLGRAPLMRWACNVFIIVALCISCCDLKLLSLGDGAVTVQVVASGVGP